MKNIIIVVLVILVICIGVFVYLEYIKTNEVFDSLKKAEEAVKSDIAILIDDVVDYKEKINGVVVVLEESVISNYENDKKLLNNDVKQSKDFLENLDNIILIDTRALIKEAKTIEIDNDKLKTLHNEYIKVLEEKEKALVTLGKSIENEVQKDYDNSKADIEKAIEKLKNHRQELTNM